ncbi:hypothetical protein CAOG_000913 [Capsaspora owczarzaki ATCC 30864]|uniref:Uncharacterized protein n=1 Tax=Capsaspora owczarzaki (strain ATCC 30864) TaxID=595528 RepID=A0A0D2X0Q1_CAPO3|nr:hypothetical protein CAOG_000913 [Capsaspora owczarzaki ATCC 30864]
MKASVAGGGRFLLCAFLNVPLVVELLYGSLAPVPLMLNNAPLMLNNATEILGGKAAFGLDGESCAKPCFSAGCRGTDGVFCTNGVIFQILPCVYIMWRSALRTKYGVQGNMLGDIIACCLCYQCAVMQDARELKLKGALYHDAKPPQA